MLNRDGNENGIKINRCILTKQKKKQIKKIINNR